MLGKSPLEPEALAGHLAGHVLHPSTWAKSRDRERELREQTVALASRLGAAGIECRQESDFDALHLVGLASGEAREVVPWRHVKLLPEVMARDARQMLRQLEGFASSIPPAQLRMWVLSWGWVPVADLGEACRSMGRAISKLAAAPWLRAAGIEVLLRRTEFTVQPGGMIHLHCHLVVRATAVLGGASWQRLLDRAKTATPKNYLHDGRLHDVAEAVKYSFKPAELLAAGDDTLAMIFRQTFKLRFLVPLGEFKEFRKSLKENNLKVCKRKSTVLGVETWQFALVRRLGAAGAEYAQESSTPPRDIVLAVTGCAAPFQPRMEPCLVVANYSGDLDGLVMRRGLGKWRELALRGWARNPSPSMEHTLTITVQPSPPLPAGPQLPGKKVALADVLARFRSRPPPEIQVGAAVPPG